MHKDFPRIISFLRRERGLSQKQAAEDLGISQSLLSHYEKGFRECGLEFLCRAADYYEVSVDYLLGRTVQRTASDPGAVPDASGFSRMKGDMVNQINRRILMNTESIIFDLLAQMGSKRLTNAVSNYLMCAEYQVFRAVYCAEPTNSQSMFSLDPKHWQAPVTAAMILDMEQAKIVIEEEAPGLALSPDILSGYFDKGASSLFNLIQFAERNARNKNL